MKRIKIIGVILLLTIPLLYIIIPGVYRNQTNNMEQVGETTAIDERKEDIQKPSDQMEEFGMFLEQLCVSGKDSIIEQYVISTKLTRAEAVALTEEAAGLEHLRREVEVRENYTVIMADVNKDGIQDIIEYGKNHENRGSLFIYLGRGNGDYNLSYAQHMLYIHLTLEEEQLGIFYPEDNIEVIHYQGENYLVFNNRGERDKYMVFWLSEGKIKGRFFLQYECKGMESEVIENQGYPIEYLLENDMDIYHRVNDQCDYWEYYDISSFWSGEGEIKDTDRQKILAEKCKEKYYQEMNTFLTEYGYHSWGQDYGVFKEFYSCDINNDGVTEDYLKHISRSSATTLASAAKWNLELASQYGVEERDAEENWDQYIIFVYGDGKYHGSHEGTERLFYYMESGGEETDFEKMCGLDIWQQGMIPMYFFVEESDKGNITYIAFRDKNSYEVRLDGYLIQGNSYERVVSVRYLPQIECTVTYEKKEDSESIDYFLWPSEDGKSVELFYAAGNGMETLINQNIRSVMEARAENTAKSLGSGSTVLELDVVYVVLEATEEKLVFSYYFLLQNQYSPSYNITVDLLTGSCVEEESHLINYENLDHAKYCQW